MAPRRYRLQILEPERGLYLDRVLADRIKSRVSDYRVGPTCYHMFSHEREAERAVTSMHTVRDVKTRALTLNTWRCSHKPRRVGGPGSRRAGNSPSAFGERVALPTP